MRTLKTTFSIVALGALYASAAAQSAAVQESVNYYTVSTSSNYVSVSSASYAYTYGYNSASGSAYNVDFVGNYAGGYEVGPFDYAYNYSAATGIGSAVQFNGEATLLQFTNDSDIYQSFGVSEAIDQIQ